MSNVTAYNPLFIGLENSIYNTHCKEAVEITGKFWVSTMHNAAKPHVLKYPDLATERSVTMDETSGLVSTVIVLHDESLLK